MTGREREITKSKFRTGIMASVLSVLMSVMIALPVYGGQWMYDNAGWHTISYNWLTRRDKETGKPYWQLTWN